MNKKILHSVFFTVLLVMFSFASVYSQDALVNGKVTAEDGTDLPGVSIRVKGTFVGTVTNQEGNYSISVPVGSTLVFSYVGMRPQEILVGNTRVINVTLIIDPLGLEEAVVVGYGTQKKASITGAVTAIKGEDIIKSPSVNITNNLVGRMPGLVAVSRDGEPGYDNSILLIRGQNTLNDSRPLIVIDGIAGRSMDRLDPADIESISVLKDATAAIYGARAANGVILITTKRGIAGKPIIKVNYNQGVSQPTRIPEMADAATYSEMINEINMYRDRDPLYSADDLQKYRDGSSPWTHPNTDWFGETFKTWSPQRYGNVSVTGGSESMQYYVSMGGNFQDAIYKNSASNYNQFDFRTNLDGQVSKNIHFSVDISGRQENRNSPTRSRGNIFRMIQRGKPNLPAFWPNGLPGPDIEYGDNPVVVATDATGYNNDKRYIFDSNVKLKVNIPWIKGLFITANAAIDKRFRNQKTFRKGWNLYTWDYTSYDENGDPDLIKGLRGFSDPQLNQYMEDNQNITLNGLINYERKFGDDHNMRVLFGVERFKGDQMNFGAFRRYFVSDVIDQMFAGSDEKKDNSGVSSESARLNYFGRLNYSFKDKYLAEFVWRYDGSFIFPADNRFGFFPGVSLGWRISEENFWKDNISIFDSFKIRASWGQTGNDRIDPYQYMSSYAFNSGRTYIFNGAESKLLSESRIPNPNVTWEIATQKNIGIDLLALDGKLYFEADYFHNQRSEILWWRNASVPNSTGLSLPRENIGEVDNQGFEYIATYRDNVGDMRFSVSVNGGYQKNKIKFWDETPGAPDYQMSTGHPMFTSLYYQSLGIFETQADVEAYPHWTNARPGDVIFEDVNDDGVIDGLDRVRMNKTDFPTFQGGIDIILQYGQFDLTILLQGAAGAVQYVDTESGEIGNFLTYYSDDRWTESNPTGSTPRTWNRDEEYWANYDNTFFLRSTDYIRLKNFELGYNFSDSFCRSIGVEGIRFYINGMNLAMIDKFKVFDPETNNRSGQGYPLNRTINGGITLIF